MSALLHLFKLLPDRDRLAAACVCKVSLWSSARVWVKNVYCLLLEQEVCTSGMEWSFEAPFLVVQTGLTKQPACS